MTMNIFLRNVSAYLAAFSRTSRVRKVDHFAFLLPSIHSIIPVSYKM